MAVTHKVYTNAMIAFMKGDIKWLTSGGSAFKCALVHDYSFNQDTHDFWDDASSTEVGASGDYSAGGQALTTTDPTVDTGTNETRMDASNTVWTGATLHATGAIIYQATGTPGTSRLISYIDFGGAQDSVAGTFTITYDTTGVFKVTATA